MTVTCRFCGDPIILNEDSLEARTAGTDPMQQMRHHLRSHPLDLLVFTRELGWLIDRLAFVPDPKDHDSYLANINRLVDHHMNESVKALFHRT